MLPDCALRFNSGRIEGYSHDSDSVVVEHCGDIFRWELVRGVADEETCLSNRTVSNNNASIAARMLLVLVPYDSVSAPPKASVYAPEGGW